MGTISVGHLRQNPTQALLAVRRGESFDVTSHGTVIARLVPAAVAGPIATAEQAAVLADGAGNEQWLAEWNAGRDQDRLFDPYE